MFRVRSNPAEAVPSVGTGLAAGQLRSRKPPVAATSLDDWGTHTLNDQQRLDLLEIFEDRYRRKSTLITAQLPVAKWHDMIGEPTIADAILHRIIHNSHRIALEGDSMRKKKAATLDRGRKQRNQYQLTSTRQPNSPPPAVRDLVKLLSVS